MYIPTTLTEDRVQIIMAFCVESNDESYKTSFANTFIQKIGKYQSREEIERLIQKHIDGGRYSIHFAGFVRAIWYSMITLCEYLNGKREYNFRKHISMEAFKPIFDAKVRPQFADANIDELYQWYVSDAVVFSNEMRELFKHSYYHSIHDEIENAEAAIPKDFIPLDY